MKTSHPEPAERRLTQTEVRLQLRGEAWMMCRDCGGKLWSFDGDEDANRHCPYRKNGTCEPHL